MNTKPDTRFRRLREKGNRDLPTACRIIDSARICHVGFTVDDFPYVVPMAHARDDKQLMIHGSVASRLVKTLADGLACCVTITHLDGLVLARSAFNSSMNYRCVMIFGQARLVTDPEEKRRGLELLTEHLAPGRVADVRPSTRQEINATSLLTIPLDTFTVKISEGPPDDPEKDLPSAVWAGVIPLSVKAGKPQPAPDLVKPVELPSYLKKYRF